MRKILNFLATDGTFLYEEHHCRIVDSEYIATFGGTGSVTLRDDVVEVRFWLDRDRLFMDLRAINRNSPQAWYSIDILKQLISGEISDKAEMDQENIDFLKAKFPELHTRFASQNVTTTEEACTKMEEQRAKRLFG